MLNAWGSSSSVIILNKIFYWLPLMLTALVHVNVINAVSLTALLFLSTQGNMTLHLLNDVDDFESTPDSAIITSLKSEQWQA